MENDLLDSCKKLLTKGYTSVVVSDSNGLPVFGKWPCDMLFTIRSADGLFFFLPS